MTRLERMRIVDPWRTA